MGTETAHLVEFCLPSLGSDMEEGTVLAWLVSPGDHVTKGDILLRVDTEKAEIDVEVWHDAVVVDLLVSLGETVPVGTVLARLETATDAVDAPTEIERPTPPAPPPEPPAPPPAAERVRSVGTTFSRATPRTVYWPAEAVELASPTASSRPEGVSAVQAPADRADRRQSAVAALMERSNSEIPHFHLVREVDVAAALAWLERHNDVVAPADRILPAALLLYAVARAAAKSPINGTFDEVPIDAEHVDLGVAVHVRGGGLMTPVLPGADVMALDTLMSELHSVAGRAKAGRLNSRDLTPATLTVTNLGDTGADAVLGVIRPPERALIGFGQIAERPVVVHGELALRRTVRVTLSADHRVINGHAGARFLDALNTVLSNPNDFILTGGFS